MEYLSVPSVVVERRIWSWGPAHAPRVRVWCLKHVGEALRFGFLVFLWLVFILHSFTDLSIKNTFKWKVKYWQSDVDRTTKSLGGTRVALRGGALARFKYVKRGVKRKHKIDCHPFERMPGRTKKSKSASFYSPTGVLYKVDTPQTTHVRKIAR